MRIQWQRQVLTLTLVAASTSVLAQPGEGVANGGYGEWLQQAGAHADAADRVRLPARDTAGVVAKDRSLTGCPTAKGSIVAFPDVCRTPAAPPPLPIPYPNVGKASDTADGSKLEADFGGRDWDLRLRTRYRILREGHGTARSERDTGVGREDRSSADALRSRIGVRWKAPDLKLRYVDDEYETR